jgi:hypothetical protein
LQTGERDCAESYGRAVSRASGERPITGGETTRFSLAAGRAQRDAPQRLSGYKRPGTRDAAQQHAYQSIRGAA